MKTKQDALYEKEQDARLRIGETETGNEFSTGKLKLQDPDAVGEVAYSVVGSSIYSEIKIEVHKLLLTVRAETGDITLFLLLLESQRKLPKIPEPLWDSHLLSGVSTSISTPIARESEENASNDPSVKDLLLKHFKISAEKFKKNFCASQARREYLAGLLF
ncbi:hypothetical protein CEXT_713421 [Caerostris extrusa]|uniref:Uncharacterized protein n=1 Tax=Caerostris extrusa TaxID=172846 RepID=A0AAV4SIH2_CAEEX|nr:hypothetical protein CEXT_713421 [Caerostris extrusa]